MYPQLQKYSRDFQLKIVPAFAHEFLSKNLYEHIQLIENILKQLMPKGEHFEDSSDFMAWLKECLPLIKWNENINPPDCLSIFLVCQSSKVSKIEHFFLDIIKKWLIPEKDVSILSFQHLYFHFENFPEAIFFASQVQVVIEDGQDLNLVYTQLPILAKEIGAGCLSPDYASYILEKKGLIKELKMTLVHQDLIRVLQRRPNDFDKTIFTEMSRFLALSNQEFRDQRSHRHMTRVVCSHHLMQKSLIRALNLFSDERHLRVRFAQTRLHFHSAQNPF